MLSPLAIEKWWQAKTAIVVKKNNGFYAVCWGENTDDPDYVTHCFIRNYDPKRGFALEYMSYYSKFGKLPFDAKFMVYFEVKIISEDLSLLKAKQTGLPNNPAADQYYNGCQKGCEQVLGNIKSYCENPPNSS